MLTLVTLKPLLHKKLPVSKQHDIILLFWHMLVLNNMMNLSENTESTLELLESRIIEFLHLYKRVFGPISTQASRTDLRKVKFHAPKHASFYIHRYGSRGNFFGGSLESALKSTMMAPTKITSRRHDHLLKDLACRQHERFVCLASRSNLAELKEELHDSNHLTTRWHFVDDSHSVATDKPPGWELHTPVFFLSREGEEGWSTHLHGHIHINSVVYPNFVSKVDSDVFGDREQQYIRKVAEYAHQNQFKRIDCSCGTSIPSSQGKQRDVFHCHPSFHSYPYLRHTWYDWAMVKWRNCGDNKEEHNYLHVTACLLLFAHLSDNEEDSTRPPVIVTVIHSLQHCNDPHKECNFVNVEEIKT